MQCSTHAVQHSAVQCSTPPHRMDDARASAGDVCRHLSKALMQYDEDKDAHTWAKRQMRPLYE
eukprot:11058408-Heterocapsa_arctica.AAC.1